MVGLYLRDRPHVTVQPLQLGLPSVRKFPGLTWDSTPRADGPRTLPASLQAHVGTSSFCPDRDQEIVTIATAMAQPSMCLLNFSERLNSCFTAGCPGRTTEA